ncbi:MAG TPA: hypothetical protein VGO80_10780 [Solirubrobacteraceae bacterium]|jgi:hypothetical protein|nr:hypothetical protein [Solirubrobacteraceae bacterium]
MSKPARYDDCPEVCGRLRHPGLATDIQRWIDHTGLDTTVDQACIEDALDAMRPGEAEQILHVGVGNSQLAERFAPRVRLVDGLTVWAPEKAFADSLHIPNYTVHFVSKYSREFLLTIEHEYDYVVDNNLASFACCKYHFHRMLDNYVWCLRPGGRILTDQHGMDWTVEDDPRWRLTYDDLVALGERFPLCAARVTDTVYELRRVDS